MSGVVARRAAVEDQRLRTAAPSRKPVRVLHVAEAFGGGLLEVVRLIAEAGTASGCAHGIVHGRRPETPSDVPAAVGDRVAVTELEWGSRRPRGELRAARQIRRLAAETGAEVVHLHSSFAGLAGVRALAGRVPLVYTPHAFASALPSRSLASRGAMRAIERRIVGAVDVVGAVSRSEAQMARAFGAREVVVIPNGIAEFDDAPLHRLPGLSPRIVSGGRLVAQRRPFDCARILAGVADLAEVAWVGGGGAERRTPTARLALEAAGVPVTGWVDRATMLDELARASAYLHWTAWDGLPLAVLEAISRDCIVVASDIPPNREILDPRQLACTEEQAIALLRRIVEDEGFAAELRAAQSARRAHFSGRRMAATWLDLYERLVRARTRAAGSAVALAA